MQTSYLIETKQLRKTFGDVVALDSVDLKLEKGKVYGLIGRNGAGKTTLLKVLSNMIFSTSGEVLMNPEEISRIGEIAFGRTVNSKYFGVKIKYLLEMAAFSYPNWNQDYAEELIDSFELDVKKYYHKSSFGMQTMTGLVIAMAANPKLLMLDEPYVGLDPINREAFYTFLRNHYFDGEKTVVLSSHLIQEIEGYFERAILIHKGRIILNEDLETIRKHSFCVRTDAEGGKRLAAQNIISAEIFGNRHTYYLYGNLSTEEQSRIIEQGGEVETMDLQTLMIQMLTKGGQHEAHQRI